jgi:hypothetical protein
MSVVFVVVETAKTHLEVTRALVNQALGWMTISNNVLILMSARNVVGCVVLEFVRTPRATTLACVLQDINCCPTTHAWTCVLGTVTCE